MSTRILLVEDDPVSREVIAAMLTSRGYDVDTADDGFGALRMAQDIDYGLVFIDYHLPEMDGYALARLMRSLGEKTNANLKMVAITADQFGLAARRGVDKIFDRLLTKPIAPDDLFAFVDEALGTAHQSDAVENFLVDRPAAAQTEAVPALALWRTRGFHRLPTVKVFPSPTPAERANIATCFTITEADVVDCILLLRPAGLAAVETLRRKASSFLMPLVVLDPGLEAMADVLFEPGDGESWTKAAGVLLAFAKRRDSVAHEVAASACADMRLAAYLFVANRGLELHRGRSGEMIVLYAAGFPVTMVVEAVKRLAATSLIETKVETAPSDGGRRLAVSLTNKGVRFVKSSSEWAQALV